MAMISNELGLVRLNADNVIAWSRPLYGWVSRQKQEDFYDFLLPFGDAKNCATFTEKLALSIKNQDVSLDDRRVPTDYWLISAGKDLIGYAKTRVLLDGKTIHEGGHIRLGIDPEHRGKGYGPQAFKELMRQVKSKGVEDILVSTFLENEPAIKMIESCGGMEESIGASWMFPGYEIVRYWIHW